MATPDKIANLIAMAHEAFPSRQITERTPELWLAVFANVSDARLEAAVYQITVEPDRKFFPTPGEIRAVLQGPPPVLDVPGFVRRIESLGEYNPHSGWIWPRVDVVRARLGDAVARAYGQVGALLGSDNETSREIAFRDFSTELTAIVQREGVKALHAPAERPMLVSGEPSPVADAVKSIAAKMDVTPSRRIKGP